MHIYMHIYICIYIYMHIYNTNNSVDRTRFNQVHFFRGSSLAQRLLRLLQVQLIASGAWLPRHWQRGPLPRLRSCVDKFPADLFVQRTCLISLLIFKNLFMNWPHTLGLIHWAHTLGLIHWAHTLGPYIGSAF